MKAKTTPVIFSKKDFAISILNLANSRMILFAIFFALFSINGMAQGLDNGQTIIQHHHSYAPSAGPFDDNKYGFNPFCVGVSSTLGNAKNSRTQMLYTQDEFTDSGANFGTITQISFKLSAVSAGSQFKCDDFTVRLGLTDIQSFSDPADQYISQDLTGLQECRTGPILIKHADWVAGDGWVTIVLTTPFNYAFTGTKNLIVEVSKTLSASGSTMISKIMVGKYSGPAYQYGVRGCLVNNISGALTPGKAMYTNIDPSLTSTNTKIAPYVGTNRSARPWIKFTYEANEMNSQSINYVGVPSGPLCIGDPITIQAQNMYGTGYLGHQWEMTTAPATGYISIPGATGTVLNTTQPLEKTYYRLRTILANGNTVDFPETTRATVAAIKTFDYVGGVPKWVDDAVPSAGESAYYKVTPPSWPIAVDVMELCSLKLDPGVELTIPSGKTLKVDRILKDDDIEGDLIFENSSSLLQSTTAQNTAIRVKYKRDSQPLLRFDYTYYSSPVKDKNLFSVSPQTLSDKFWSYQNNDWVMETASTIMEPGKGYIIRGSQAIPISGTPEVFNALFDGIPNNGNISLAADPVVGHYNLIGNPYPSAIDASKFIFANNFLDGAIYLWSHATQPSTAYTGTGTYNYNNDDYVGITGLGATNGSTLNFVGAGQSFMVKTIAAGANMVQWKNDMRVGGNNTQFYKMQNPNLVAHNSPVFEANPAPQNPEPAGRFWLDLQANNGAVQRMLIGYIQGATEDYDRMYDAEPMEIGSTALYALANNQQRLSIMAKGLPFNNEQIIPLGFVTAVPGNHTISKFQEDGFMSDYAVYLNDKLTNTSHNLSESAYEFATAAGTFDNRFVIAFKSKAPAIVDNPVKPNKVVVFDKFEAVQLHSGKDIMSSVIVYDLSGRILANVQNCNSTEVALSKLPRKNQLLVVEIHLENGDKEIQKFRF